MMGSEGMNERTTLSCKWCDYETHSDDEEQEYEYHYFDAFYYHLKEEHFEEMVRYYIDNHFDEGTHGIDKKHHIVTYEGDTLLSNNPDEVECPFCDYTPPKEAEESDGVFQAPDPCPWESTLWHISNNHFEEYLNWLEDNTESFYEELIDCVLDDCYVEEE